jgi:subtilisin family serine protease
MAQALEDNCQLPPYVIHQIGDIETLSQVANWGITDLDIPDIWKKTQGEGVVIAILDSGVANHSDLNKNILFDKCRSFIDNEWEDKIGHGTHVSGIASSIDNTYGVVGVAHKAKIVNIKVLSDNGFSTSNSITKGLEYCLDLKPDIINLSVGGPNPMPEAYEVIKKLDKMDIIMVASAGNNGEKTDKSILYPAKYENVIAVGSYSPTTITSKSVFSCVGPEIDIAAPGDQILSTYLNDQFAILSGTSMSSPVISGVIALYISYLKKNKIPYTAQSVKDVILKNCKDVGEEGFDHEFGWGIISPKKIFQALNAQPTAIPVKKIPWWKKLFGLT